MSEHPDPPDQTSSDAPAGTGPELEVDVTAFLAEPEPTDAAQLSAELDRVDAALAALDAKTYGRDAQTGEPIADHLLAADPTRLSSP